MIKRWLAEPIQIARKIKAASDGEKAHRKGGIRSVQTVIAAEAGFRIAHRHHLGAIDHGKALLLLELDWSVERILREELAFAHQAECKVGERAQVAGRAHRALLGDPWNHAEVDCLSKLLDKFHSDAGVAFEEAVQS